MDILLYSDTFQEDQKDMPLKKGRTRLIKNMMEQLEMSARAYEGILKVSRTITDLEVVTDQKAEHLAKAIHYRSLDWVSGRGL